MPGGSGRDDVCELAGLDIAELEAVFKVVFEALFGSACLPVPLLQLAEEDPSWETVLGNLDGVAGPSKLMLASMLVLLACCITSQLETFSCHRIPIIDLRDRPWNVSSCVGYNCN